MHEAMVKNVIEKLASIELVNIDSLDPQENDALSFSGRRVNPDTKETVHFASVIPSRLVGIEAIASPLEPIFVAVRACRKPHRHRVAFKLAVDKSPEVK